MIFTKVSKTAIVTCEICIVGISTTLLVGTSGYELGRLAGPAEWDNLEMTSFLSKQTSKMKKKRQTTSPV